MLYSVCPKQTLSMTTSDGVRLDADVYYPDSNSPDSRESFPVLLMRQPYGRSIASTVVYAHPSWYAAQGYIVVIQDVRGRGSSEGEFDLFVNEIADGYEAVQWAAGIPQSTGQVGMYGFSYQGMTQLFAAAKCPPALKTICPAMAAYDLYEDWAYEGGAFCYQLNLGWGIQLASETVRRQGKTEAYQTLYSTARNLPLTDAVNPRSPLLEELAPDCHYHPWLKESDPQADYWQQRSPCYCLQEVDLPMLHIGGAYDTHLRGTVKLYQTMTQQTNSSQHLIIGPWAHLPWSRKVGAVDFGEAAHSPIDRLQIRWFDHFLKGIDTGLLEEPPIAWFELGSNEWRKFNAFPNPVPQKFYLETTGLGAMSEQEGRLTIDSPNSPLPDTVVHDPWRPVPSLGGHSAYPAGCFDRSAIDGRSDVLTYTTDPLTADLHFAGEIVVELQALADAPSFDLCAVLSEVKPNGAAFNLTQGYLRISSSEPAAGDPYRIILQPLCARIAAGHSLRLSISGACFPAYAMNSGTGSLPQDSQLLEAKVITITVRSDIEERSQLLLPVI
ncbi:CocE/NonD family hydrolase [Leptolyngbya ohadii]|uniref:CocE/NonD family hydrolase n=1 Tax=Leptolyngbya ohadii TaxID=1962290 RepID=UPI0019D4B1AA|nr:CocE/NonD family hydrolase [Leptolyngbya ohadii]